MSAANRGANGSNGSKWIRPEKRRRIYRRDGWRCVWCTEPVGLTGEWAKEACVDLATLDHVLPRGDGGTNDAHNLITACRRCNSERRSLDAYTFARALCRRLNGESPGSILYRVLRACLAPFPPADKAPKDRR